jgi:hypothetical protein
LNRLLLNADVLGVISAYYGSQPYFRRIPAIQQRFVEPRHQADISTAYHIDGGTHNVGIVLLLSDLTEEQFHMRHLIGTHRIEQERFRLDANNPHHREFEKQLEQQYQVFPLVGPKGTMFIYDHGNGIHKGHTVMRTLRNMMQALLSNGNYMSVPGDLELLPSRLAELVKDAAPVVRCSVERVIGAGAAV